MEGGLILCRHLIAKKTDNMGLRLFSDENDVPEDSSMSSLLKDTKGILISSIYYLMDDYFIIIII